METEYKYILDDDGTVCAQLPDGTDFPIYNMSCPIGYFCQTYQRRDVEPVLKVIKKFYDKRHDLTLNEIDRIASESPKRSTDWCRRQLLKLTKEIEDFEG